MDGLSLAELVEIGGPAPVAEVLDLGARLAALHTAGLVHRDVSPRTSSWARTVPSSSTSASRAPEAGKLTRNVSSTSSPRSRRANAWAIGAGSLVACNLQDNRQWFSFQTINGNVLLEAYKDGTAGTCLVVDGSGTVSEQAYQWPIPDTYQWTYQ